MYKIVTGLLLFFTVTYHLDAQILPREDSKLNYRLIGFSLSQGQPGCTYKIEIAAGNYNSADSFKENIINSYSGDKNKIIGEVPSFGKQYTWRSVTNNGLGTINGELHHFSTLTDEEVDSSITRLRILKPAEKYKDAYVFMDGSKTMYDMNGHPVWFLPAIDGAPVNQFNMICDLTLTSRGTITFLTNRQNGNIYEVNYNGTVLWKGPNTGVVSGDSTENYHHEFTRLQNGHYMVLGNEPVSWKLPGSVDSSFLNHPGNQGKIRLDSTTNTFYENMEFGTIIEYDQKGNVAWSWKSSSYFKGADVYSSTARNGTYYVQDVHANSFYFDEKAQVIYMSFKNISRILKIKYPEGNILNVYGWKFDRHHKGYGPDQFSYQHNCRVSEEGYLYMFNNNTRHYGELPTLIMLQEPHSENDTLKKIWEYKCTTEGIDTSIKEIPVFSALGSVFELPDHSIFACMASFGYTKAFIVSPDKKILWSALLERWNVSQNKWVPMVQYRASIILNHKDLEQLIWNTETAKTNE